MSESKIFFVTVHRIKREQELLQILSDHFKIDFRYLGLDLVTYLKELSSYLNYLEVPIDAAIGEIEEINTFCSLDRNLMLNLPLVLSYHKESMRLKMNEKSQIMQRSQEERMFK